MYCLFKSILLLIKHLVPEFDSHWELLFVLFVKILVISFLSILSNCFTDCYISIASIDTQTFEVVYILISSAISFDKGALSFSLT